MIKKGKYNKENMSGGNTINNINGKHWKEREKYIYRSMVPSIRTEVLSDKVKECNNNSGKL